MSTEIPIVYDKFEASRRSGFSVNFFEKNAAARKIPFTWRRGRRGYGWTDDQLKEIAAMQQEPPARETHTITEMERSRRQRKARRTGKRSA